MRHTLKLLSPLVAVFPFSSSAQRLDVLPEPITRQISEEISGDAAYAHIRHNSQYHRPRGGSDGLWKVAQYYEEKAREYGLSDVKIIKQKYGTTRPWNAKGGELWITGDQPERIASTIQTPLHLADFSRAADVTAELIDIGLVERKEVRFVGGQPEGCAPVATAFAEGGFKGAGEAGTAGAPGAVLNAVNDALSPFEARITRVPMTPEVILRALGKL